MLSVITIRTGLLSAMFAGVNILPQREIVLTRNCIIVAAEILWPAPCKSCYFVMGLMIMENGVDGSWLKRQPKYVCTYSAKTLMVEFIMEK